MIYLNARFLTQKTSGVQRFAMEISLRLKEVIPDIVFLTPKNVIHNEMASALEAHKIGLLKGHLWEQIELPYYLKKLESPVLINLTNTGPILNRNHIATIHDLAFRLHKKWFSWKARMLYNSIIPRFAKKAKHVLTVSSFSKQQIVQELNIPKEQITIVPNAVSGFNNILPKTDFRYKNTNYILAVGSIDPRKNLKNLILSYEKANLGNIKLLLVGDQKRVFNSSELDIFARNKNIIFTGYISDSDLVSIYTHAKAFIYASVYEGFGIPPLEAMYFGCPTAVSDIDVLQETCGKASIYFDPYDINSMAESIRTVAKNDECREKLIQLGYKRVRKFSWDESAKQIARLVSGI